MIVAKEHLTKEGLLKIVATKSLFPQGQNKSLLKAFPSLRSIPQPDFIPFTSPLDPNWIAGFVNGDGCFSLKYQKSSTHRLGARCNPCLQVTQHERDRFLLERIVSSLGCGSIHSNSKNGVLNLTVTGLPIITSKIIPFFYSHSLSGAKALDFRDFCQGIKIMNLGGHQTLTGLQQLKDLYNGMNSNRTKF